MLVGFAARITYNNPWFAERNNLKRINTFFDRKARRN